MADILGTSAAEWVDMCGNTVTIDAWVSASISGVPAFAGAPASYPAYIEMKNHLIIDKGGREIMARGRVFIPMVVNCSVKDKLTLPAGYVPLTPPILSVDLQNDELGSHHTVLEVG